MTNSVLLLGISLFLIYAIYDQVIMDKIKGRTLLSVRLQRQAGTDSIILIGLILLTIYQGVMQQIEALTLFLLSTCIILNIYSSFIRFPKLLLKPHGFFFGNIYFQYKQIYQINLAENHILVIDMKKGKRLLVRFVDQSDIDSVVQFFGGYKK